MNSSLFHLKYNKWKGIFDSFFSFTWLAWSIFTFRFVMGEKTTHTHTHHISMCWQYYLLSTHMMLVKSTVLNIKAGIKSSERLNRQHTWERTYTLHFHSDSFSNEKDSLAWPLSIQSLNYWKKGKTIFFEKKKAWRTRKQKVISPKRIPSLSIFILS